MAKKKITPGDLAVPEPTHNVRMEPHFYENEDGHLCKSCKFRPSQFEKNRLHIGCNYFLITGNLRGCSPSYCTAYKRGELQRVDAWK